MFTTAIRFDVNEDVNVKLYKLSSMSESWKM